jgi:arginine exporter protein ArgO
VVVGVIIVFQDHDQLGAFLAYLGAPVTAAIGFYCWKAKAENIMKLKRENPEETAGISVDLNAVQP